MFSLLQQCFYNQGYCGPGRKLWHVTLLGGIVEQPQWNSSWTALGCILGSHVFTDNA